MRDIGAGGVTILDPASFSAATAPIIGIVGGKTGKSKQTADYISNKTNTDVFSVCS
jgi:hypothetical protein